MQKRVYIETDVHTANVMELLLDEIRRLHEKVDRLQRSYDAKETPDVAPRLLTIEQTRRMLNISISTLYNMRRKGSLPCKKVGGKVMFLISDLEKYLEK